MQISNLRAVLMAATGLVSLSMATQGHAQTAAPADGAATPDNTEVIVTTQKRSQRVFKVPVAVSVVSSAFMKDQGINDFAQLSRFVPGFEVQDQSPNNPGFVIRGITSDSGAAVGETRVSVFQDGVSISRSRGSYVELFDLNRVEVAKGPQSTLFGRGALIGAVNIVQNKADPKAFATDLSASTGNLNYHQADAMFNVPLSDTTAIRLSARIKNRDGYVDNLLGGSAFDSLDTMAWRGAFNYHPDDNFNLDLIYNTQSDRNTGTSFKSGIFAPTDPTSGALLGTTSHYTGAALTTFGGFHDGRDLGLRRTVEGTTLLMSYKLNNAYTLSSTTALRHFNSSEVFDADGFSLPLLTAAEDAKARQASQEVRINYDNQGKLNWFAGASYFEEHGQQGVPLQIDELGYLALLGHLINPASPPTDAQIKAGLLASPTYAPFVPYLKTTHREGYTNFGDTRSFDAYADMTYRFTSKLEVSAGLRFTHDDKVSGYQSTVSDTSGLAALQYAKSATTAFVTGYAMTHGGALPSAQQQQAYLSGTFAGALALPLGLTVQPTNGRVGQSFSDDGMTFRVVGRYEFSPELNTYLSYATGRQPRVFSGSAPAAPFGAPTFTEAAAEKVDSLEWGAKSRLMDGRLNLDGAVYDYKYKNFQTQVQVSTTEFATESAGEAESYGFESEATFRPMAHTMVFASYAYSHARFGNGLYKGNSFRLNPDNKVSLGGKFDLPLATGTVSFLPTYLWQSKTYFDDNNDLPQFQTSIPDTIQDEVQKAYGLLNLRLAYTPANAPWSVELFVDNATGVKYIKDAGNTGDTFGSPTFIQGAPMTFGLTFRFHD